MFIKEDFSQAGFSLIEIIITVVVLGVLAVGMIGIFNISVVNSVDPMLRIQAIAIAQGYLEEALLKDFQDPDDTETGSCEEGAAPTNRRNYDDVQDYNCINDTAGALDQFGNTLTGLEQYNVTVSVTATPVGSFSQSTTMQRVVVAITHDSQPVNFSLTGYRGNY